MTPMFVNFNVQNNHLSALCCAGIVKRIEVHSRVVSYFVLLCPSLSLPLVQEFSSCVGPKLDCTCRSTHLEIVMNSGLN